MTLDQEERVFWGIVVVVLLLIFAAVFLIVHEEVRTAKYLDEHGCTETEKKKTTYVLIGKVFTPITTHAWVCPDGTTIWH